MSLFQINALFLLIVCCKVSVSWGECNWWTEQKNILFFKRSLPINLQWAEIICTAAERRTLTFYVRLKRNNFMSQSFTGISFFKWCRIVVQKMLCVLLLLKFRPQRCYGLDYEKFIQLEMDKVNKSCHFFNITFKIFWLDCGGPRAQRKECINLWVSE